jgi:hypothetical protein
MAKANSGAKKQQKPAPKATKSATVKKVAKPAPAAKATPVKAAPKAAAKASAAKPAAKAATPAKPAAKEVAKTAAKAAPKPVAKAAPAAKAAPPAKAAPAPKGKAGGKEITRSKAHAAPASPPSAATPEQPKPRATKLPAVGQPLTKREMEQLLTAGTGRGVAGEGSLKGRLLVKDEFPYLHVVGRDKRELVFLLQGPDQEVLPAYNNHKVSVSGFIKKTTNYGGSVDVRKYAAKTPESETQAAEPAVVEEKLRFLSPGEIEQVSSAGMGAGMRGFGSLRGNLEMTGEDFFLVLSGGGTRLQVSFLLEGKHTKGLRKHLGQTLQVMGVVDKTSGWGGKVQVEAYEPRPAEYKALGREGMEVSHVENLVSEEKQHIEVRLNQGLTVRLTERPGYTWAIEPTMAKRVGLREANYEPGSGDAPATREFFFTPRNPGTFDVEFFLAKAFTPAQVAQSCVLGLTVKP